VEIWQHETARQVSKAIPPSARRAGRFPPLAHEPDFIRLYCTSQSESTLHLGWYLSSDRSLPCSYP